MLLTLQLDLENKFNFDGKYCKYYQLVNVVRTQQQGSTFKVYFFLNVVFEKPFLFQKCGKQYPGQYIQNALDKILQENNATVTHTQIKLYQTFAEVI